jgi:hypothetical protein
VRAPRRATDNAHLGHRTAQRRARHEDTASARDRRRAAVPFGLPGHAGYCAIQDGGYRATCLAATGRSQSNASRTDGLPWSLSASHAALWLSGSRCAHRTRRRVGALWSIGATRSGRRRKA